MHVCVVSPTPQVLDAIKLQNESDSRLTTHKSRLPSPSLFQAMFLQPTQLIQIFSERREDEPRVLNSCT